MVLRDEIFPWINLLSATRRIPVRKWPSFLYFDIGWKSVVSFTTWPLSLQGTITQYTLGRKLWSPHSRSRQCTKEKILDRIVTQTPTALHDSFLGILMTLYQLLDLHSVRWDEDYLTLVNKDLITAFWNTFCFRLEVPKRTKITFKPVYTDIFCFQVLYWHWKCKCSTIAFFCVSFSALFITVISHSALQSNM